VSLSRGIWHLIAGEYPPDRGGVGDHTSVLASALANAGWEVHVWTGGMDAPGSRAPVDEGDSVDASRANPSDPADATVSADSMMGVHVHRVAGAFDRAGLRRLSEELDAFAAPRALLVQYAPRAFGRNGMNVGFCCWVGARRRAGDDVRMMFHEPFFPFGIQSLRRNVLAAVNHLMAALLLCAASRAYVSIPAWRAMLRPWAPRRLGAMAWLPVASTVPRVDDPAAVARIRASVAGPDAGGPIIGHFGTYGEAITAMLTPALRLALRETEGAAALLLGQGGPRFADELARGDDDLRARIAAPGYLPADEVSLHLQACDVVIQPYPDGASSRRTTLLAALANGVPTVTTTGFLTEDAWSIGPVPLQPAGDAEGLAHAALALLNDAARRAETGTAGRCFYERNFSIHRAVEVLTAE
jgi:glycosyltransferase involved in cell wall biosynthesis